MRVVAGQWRGRRLRSPTGSSVRPTGDRVKEALFSMIGGRVQGCEFIDLCCGAGGLGIEALSRGAASAVFVDTAAASLVLVGDNLKLCGAAPDSFRLVCADALDWLKHWRPSALRPWLLVADPPYRTSMAGLIMDRLTERCADGECRGAVVEQSTGEVEPGSVDPRWKLRHYGQTTLALWLPPSP